MRKEVKSFLHAKWNITKYRSASVKITENFAAMTAMATSGMRFLLQYSTTESTFSPPFKASCTASKSPWVAAPCKWPRVIVSNELTCYPKLTRCREHARSTQQLKHRFFTHLACAAHTHNTVDGSLERRALVKWMQFRLSGNEQLHLNAYTGVFHRACDSLRSRTQWSFTDMLRVY